VTVLTCHLCTGFFSINTAYVSFMGVLRLNCLSLEHRIGDCSLVLFSLHDIARIFLVGYSARPFRRLPLAECDLLLARLERNKLHRSDHRAAPASSTSSTSLRILVQLQMVYSSHALPDSFYDNRGIRISPPCHSYHISSSVYSASSIISIFPPPRHAITPCCPCATPIHTILR